MLARALPRAAAQRIDAGRRQTQRTRLRPCGSYLATGAHLDNPESSRVVARDARSHVRVRHRRHACVDAVIVDDLIGQPWPARSGKAR
jgi:hypothetical protein